VFLNAKRKFQIHKSIDEFLDRNLTPPYLSNQAESRHFKLKVDMEEAYLIMCSDGLLDLYKESKDLPKLTEKWFRIIDEVSPQIGNTNLAVRLLRDGMGGNDNERVSRLITVEMEHKWMDDTSIIVQRLR
jgi:pyruvate dehydrogenase phosphatase